MTTTGDTGGTYPASEPGADANEQALPWWFPPDFRAESGFLASNPASGEDRAPLITRAAIEAQFGYRITTMNRPVPIAAPTRVFTEEQMARARHGYEAQVMEEKWHTFLEGDRLFIPRSWTGICIYEAVFAPTRTGWHITEAVVESDFTRYLVTTAAYETVQLEWLIVNGLLDEGDEEVEARYSKEQDRAERGPRIVITKAKGAPLPISPPGYSVKHGKLADQHPLQRDAYDHMRARGWEAGRKALAKGMTAQDIYYSAHRHEERALMAVGIESSQHAGLAKGAKMAAYQHGQG